MEMQEKFGEQYHVILPEEFDTIRRITRQQDIYGQFDQVILSDGCHQPLDHRAGWSDEKVADYNRERSEAIVNSGWGDLIVIDEVASYCWIRSGCCPSSTGTDALRSFLHICRFLRLRPQAGNRTIPSPGPHD